MVRVYPEAPRCPATKKTSIVFTCITQTASPNTVWDCIENQGQRHTALLANDVNNNSFQTERLEVLCIDSLPLGPTGRTLSGADQLMKTNEKCPYFLSTAYLNTAGHTASSPKHIGQHIHYLLQTICESIATFIYQRACVYIQMPNGSGKQPRKDVVPHV